MRSSTLAAVVTLFAATVSAQTNTYRYAVTLDNLGSKVYWRLSLTDANGTLTGDLDGDTVNGTRSGDHIKFHAYDKNGGTEDLDGTVSGNHLTGTIVWLHDGDPPAKATTHNFTAELFPARPADAKPSRREFAPTQFYRQFSSSIAPVLHLWPGDTLHTTTVDAGGSDERNVRRSPGGNPETGPFYIETAWPGDTLAVHINHLRLNRDSAISDNGIVPRALAPGLAVKTRDNEQDVTWHLDLSKGVATTSLPGDHLKSYTVPLHPMLGCMATAPGGTGVAIPTGDSGNFGGNMDFNEITEGVTVYLPVNVPGALLFLGDAHAAQGDGELNGNALETSMDVEVTVDLIPGRNNYGPRVENADAIIALGYAGSVDDSLREATANMANWLAADYKLSPSEYAQVLGTVAEIKVTEVADRNAGVAVKIRKDRLATIGK